MYIYIYILYVYIYIYWLVVLSILKNISKWEGLSHPYIYICGKIKMVQTANQYIHIPQEDCSFRFGIVIIISFWVVLTWAEPSFCIFCSVSFLPTRSTSEKKTSDKKCQDLHIFNVHSGSEG